MPPTLAKKTSVKASKGLTQKDLKRSTSKTSNSRRGGTPNTEKGASQEKKKAPAPKKAEAMDSTDLAPKPMKAQNSLKSSLANLHKQGRLESTDGDDILPPSLADDNFEGNPKGRKGPGGMQKNISLTSRQSQFGKSFGGMEKSFSRQMGGFDQPALGNNFSQLFKSPHQDNMGKMGSVLFGGQGVDKSKKFPFGAGRQGGDFFDGNIDVSEPQMLTRGKSLSRANSFQPDQKENPHPQKNESLFPPKWNKMQPQLNNQMSNAPPLPINDPEKEHPFLQMQKRPSQKRGGRAPIPEAEDHHPQYSNPSMFENTARGFFNPRGGFGNHQQFYSNMNNMNFGMKPNGFKQGFSGWANPPDQSPGNFYPPFGGGFADSSMPFGDQSTGYGLNYNNFKPEFDQFRGKRPHPMKQEPMKADPKKDSMKKRDIKYADKTKSEEVSAKAEMNPATKKRGRKREKDDAYFDRAQKKIQEIKSKLKTAKKDGMDVKERQRLRNQVSAQQSRIKKKEEVISLNRMIREKDDNSTGFIESFFEVLGSSDTLDKNEFITNLLASLKEKYSEETPEPKNQKMNRGMSFGDDKTKEEELKLLLEERLVSDVKKAVKDDSESDSESD